MYLLLDASTEVGIVALMEDEKVLWSQEIEVGPHRSRMILPVIDQGIKQMQAKPEDLTSVVVGNGPGSYTGLRIAASAGQSIAFALSIPLVGVCSLLSLAPEEDGPYFSVYDARMGGVYLLECRKEGEKVISTGNPEIVSLDEFCLRVPEQMRVATPHANRLQERLGAKAQKWIWEQKSLNPSLLGKAAQMTIPHKSGPFPLQYLKKTFAERQISS